MLTKRSSKTLKDLREKLNLTGKPSLISDYDLINYIQHMSDNDYGTILMEYYVNQKYPSRIMEEDNGIFYSDFRGIHNTAVKNLRLEIITDFMKKEDLPIRRFFEGPMLYRLGIDRSSTVGSVIEYIEKMDFKRNKDTDMLIKGLFLNGYTINYPPFLLKYPDYPYNLYSNYLTNHGIRYSGNAKSIYEIYLRQIGENPNYSLRNFIVTHPFIFTNSNTLLSDKQKLIGKLYYQDNLSTITISKKLGMEDINVRKILYHVIQIFNTPEGKEFIHIGVPR